MVGDRFRERMVLGSERASDPEQIGATAVQFCCGFVHTAVVAVIEVDDPL
jgi:hypothetical protein